MSSKSDKEIAAGALAEDANIEEKEKSQTQTAANLSDNTKKIPRSKQEATGSTESMGVVDPSV